MKRCLIFGAGERAEDRRIAVPDDSDFVIAADGGLFWLRELSERIPKLRTQLYVGDFDSSAVPEEAVRSLCEQTGAEIVALPVRKDDTDTGVAVREGLRRGYRQFYLYGGTGGRWDHTLANCQLCVRVAREGGRAFLIGTEETSFALHADGATASVRIRGEQGRTFSVFSAGGEVSGVTITGALYEVSSVTLRDDYALGVSNSFTAEETLISCEKGTLLIVGEFLPCDVMK